MTHTLLGANRATHFKIIAVAMAGAIVAVLVGMNAGMSNSHAAGGRAQASDPILKAGKPA